MAASVTTSSCTPTAIESSRPRTPAVSERLDDAIAAAASFLYDAHMPLVYGLSNITCEAQREAVALAELIGGVVDSHTSL